MYSAKVWMLPFMLCHCSNSGTAGGGWSSLENRYDFFLPLDRDEACYYRHWVSCDFACHHPCSENWSKNCSHDSIFILCSFSSGNSFHFTVSTIAIKWRTSKGGSIGSTPACGPWNLKSEFKPHPGQFNQNLCSTWIMFHVGDLLCLRLQCSYHIVFHWYFN